MKARLEIPEEIYRKAKKRATVEGRRIGDLVTEGLQHLLETAPPISRSPLGILTLPLDLANEDHVLVLSNRQIARLLEPESDDGQAAHAA